MMDDDSHSLFPDSFNTFLKRKMLVAVHTNIAVFYFKMAHPICVTQTRCLAVGHRSRQGACSWAFRDTVPEGTCHTSSGGVVGDFSGLFETSELS